MRIAVCDDNAVFLQFFKSMLANELESRSVKAEIETFTKAESFFYSHGKKPFSAIFLDLDMPEMTGFEVARQLGQNGNCFVSVSFQAKCKKVRYYRYFPLGRVTLN